jgi:D-aminopeptidase
VGVELGMYYFKRHLNPPPASPESNETKGSDGSCMIVVITDAPLDTRNLKRLAKRALAGLTRAGGIMSNGSGDYVIAVSTAEELRIPYKSSSPLREMKVLRNNAMSPLFMAVIEATEEAVLNSMFAAVPVKGKEDHMMEAIPIEKVLEILKKYNRIGVE